MAEIKSIEKRTFQLHIAAQFFNGISLGFLLLQDIILKKSLEGTDFQIMLLAFLASTANLASIYGTEIVNRSRNRSRTIIRMGIAAKLFLVLAPLFNNAIFYILCIAVSAYLDAMLLSSWNIVYKHNYSESKRSKLFSYVATIATIMILITSTVFGYFLDMNYSLYRICFPIAGLMGMLTYYNLSKMISLSMDDYLDPGKKSLSTFSSGLLKDILILPIRDMLRIFKNNRPFLRFEFFFFLYGIAFMVILPAVPVFLVDHLGMSYAPISAAKGLVFHSALILFTPLMGRIHGSGNPTKFCGYIFLILALYPLLMIAAKYIGFAGFHFDKVMVVFAAHFFFGLGMSGITIAWSLSTIYFAPVAEVSNYQAAHITLTGIRGIFSPVLGYAVMKIFAIEYTFLLSAVLFIIGGILMLIEYKKTQVIALNN
jgi:MFS family permease